MSYLITFEGIEGCGKSTQIQLLAEYFLKNKIEFIQTREPGGTALGEKIRPLLLDRHANPSPLSELLLYAADRAQHCSEKILPNLRQKKIILSDRFTDSTLAYQHGGRKIERSLIENLIVIAAQGLKPHLTFLFDCPVELGLKRARGRNQKQGDNQDRFENLDFNFHEAVRKEYLKIAAQEPHRVYILDAVLNVEEIHQKILQALKILCPRDFFPSSL